MYKILVIDDNIKNTERIRSSLQEEGYEVITCINGSEGWNKINFHRPDLVLTEITLPGMDGFRLISHISEHFPEMKVIVMSSRSVINAFEYLKVARTYGIEFSILKPFRDEYLKLVVNRLMNSDNRLAGVG